MNTTFNTTINLFIFILFLLHSVSYKKMELRIWKHRVIISILNTVVCITTHHRGKFLFILKTKIQLKQSNRYYYLLYYYIYTERVYSSTCTYPTMSIQVGRIQFVFMGTFTILKHFALIISSPRGVHYKLKRNEINLKEANALFLCM